MFQDVWEWFQPHWTSYPKCRILDPIQNSDLIAFRILGLQHFHWLLWCMRVRDWNLIKHINSLCTLMLVVLMHDCWSCLNSFDKILIKMCPSVKQNHLLSMGIFFSLFLTLGLGISIKIVGCWLISLEDQLWDSR